MCETEGKGRLWLSEREKRSGSVAAWDYRGRIRAGKDNKYIFTLIRWTSATVRIRLADTMLCRYSMPH